MLPVFCKVFEIILLRKRETNCCGKRVLSHMWFGFSEGVDCLVVSCVIIERMNQLSEKGSKGFACFPHLRKALI